MDQTTKAGDRIILGKENFKKLTQSGEFWAIPFQLFLFPEVGGRIHRLCGPLADGLEPAAAQYFFKFFGFICDDPSSSDQDRVSRLLTGR
jgi:hypothetical protein